MSEEIITFKNVSKTFGSGEGIQKAVDNVSFTVNEGEFVVILGQSGAGKSTVLNMHGGLDKQTEGKSHQKYTFLEMKLSSQTT